MAQKFGEFILPEFKRVAPVESCPKVMVISFLFFCHQVSQNFLTLVTFHQTCEFVGNHSIFIWRLGSFAEAGSVGFFLSRRERIDQTRECLVTCQRE
jgi:hypothetical protein